MAGVATSRRSTGSWTWGRPSGEGRDPGRMCRLVGVQLRLPAPQVPSSSVPSRIIRRAKASTSGSSTRRKHDSGERPSGITWSELTPNRSRDLLPRGAEEGDQRQHHDEATDQDGSQVRPMGADVDAVQVLSPDVVLADLPLVAGASPARRPVTYGATTSTVGATRQLRQRAAATQICGQIQREWVVGGRHWTRTSDLLHVKQVL